MELDSKNKKRILLGIIAVLILINLSALGALGYQKYVRNHNAKKGWMKNMPIENKNDRIKQYVKKELKLNDKQCTVYFKSMDENFAQTKLMIDKIGQCKSQIMTEITQENPDTLKINQLCDSLGYFNIKMQRGMNRHFLGVMKILDSGQKVKLKEMLMKLHEKDNNKKNENQNWRN